MDPSLPEDCSFGPANHKLISLYLRRRVEGEPLPPAVAAYFHDVDIYTADPAALTAGVEPVPAGKGEASSWLFFTPVRTKSSKDRRKCRRVGGGLGTWHSEHAPEAVVDDEGTRVGQRQLFSYKGRDGRRSGWSMWELSAAGQDVGDSMLVLCKIHQAHAGSRRAADGSAAKATRKRKAADDGGDRASAPVRRRFVLAPPAPTPPATSQGEIGAAPEAVPCSTTESVACKDRPRSVLSFWDEPPTSDDMINAPSGMLPSFTTEPVESQENVVSTSSLEESLASRFLNPELEASQVNTTTFDYGLVMADAAPVATGSEASFMNSGGDMAEWSLGSLRELLASISAPVTGYYDTTPTCSGNNPFLGGVPRTYNEVGAEGSGSWNGYNTTASWYGDNAFINGSPAYAHCGISGSTTGVQYGCSMPSDTFLPSTTPSQWCGVSSSTTFLPPAAPSQWCGAGGPSLRSRL